MAFLQPIGMISAAVPAMGAGCSQAMLRGSLREVHKSRIIKEVSEKYTVSNGKVMIQASKPWGFVPLLKAKWLPGHRSAEQKEAISTCGHSNATIIQYKARHIRHEGSGGYCSKECRLKVQIEGLKCFNNLVMDHGFVTGMVYDWVYIPHCKNHGYLDVCFWDVRTSFSTMTCLWWSLWKRDCMLMDAWSCNMTGSQDRHTEQLQKLALRPGLGNWTY